jgi:hypothetical protein
MICGSEPDRHGLERKRRPRTMDPKIEVFLMALDDFALAAQALDEAWELASDEVGDRCNEGYPFANSFGEVAFSIRQWGEASRKKLGGVE